MISVETIAHRHALNKTFFGENVQHFFGGQLISEMLKKELDVRLEKRVARSLKRSKIGAVEDLATFDFFIRPQLLPHIIKELCD